MQLLIYKKPPISSVGFISISQTGHLAGIIRGSNGVGVVDAYREMMFEPEYDEIKYEMKIIACKNGEEISKCIPVGSQKKREDDNDYFISGEIEASDFFFDDDEEEN